MKEKNNNDNMKSLINNLRLLFCEILLRVIVYVVPLDMPDGLKLIEAINRYIYIKFNPHSKSS